MRQLLLLFLFPLLLPAPTAHAQRQTQGSTDRRPTVGPRIRSGSSDAGRLNARRIDGDTLALALEQTDCPLTVSPMDLAHDERGSTLKLRVLNEGSAAVSKYTVQAWVVMPDGTLKGSQRFDQKQAITDGAERQVSIVIRTIRVAPTDTVVVAVVETQGDVWKGDAKALEAEARAAVAK